MAAVAPTLCVATSLVILVDAVICITLVAIVEFLSTVILFVTALGRNIICKALVAVPIDMLTILGSVRLPRPGTLRWLGAVLSLMRQQNSSDTV